MKYVEVIGVDSKEKLIDFLNDNGVKAELINFDKWGFSREIGFTVYDVKYVVIWFKNNSTLCVGTHKRPAQIPFRYVFFDNCFPLVDGNKSIGFAYEKQSGTSTLDREFLYESFRIPIEIE